MEGRDFAAPAHLLSERGALVHRAASRIAPSGHSSVQHAGHFPPGKYYPSHIPMAPHSSGLMGNSSASFMGTFLASSLGSPPSHPPHPSRPPSSPSSPSFRGGPHSSASQIWFPHSHEGPGYPRFSGSLAHTFLPMSHLDHHANSGVLYGQHRFYDTQKNFYLRGLPSQPSLISANHSLPSMSRTGSGHSQGSCSRDRDPGLGAGIHKGLKEGTVERGVVPVKDKERSSGKQDAKERQQQQQQHQNHQTPQTTHHHHSHTHQQQSHYPQHPLPLEEVNSRALERHKASLTMEYTKDHHQTMSKPLSACLHNGKMPNGDPGTTTGSKVSLPSCGGEGTGLRSMVDGGSSQGRHIGSNVNGRCTKEGVSGEMRISEQPSDCLERGQAPLHHSLPYSVPPPLHMGSAAGGAHSHPHPHAHPHSHPHPGGFHCLQLHPSHPHHPHHSHHTHHHPDFFCPPPPAPLANPASQDRGTINVGREPKVTGPTFVPSVADLGDKTNGPFQLGNPDCQGVVNGGGSTSKDKAIEKGGSGHHSNWQRKQQQQHPYRKTEKSLDWMQSHHQHVQPSQLPSQPQQQQQKTPHSQQQHQVVRSRSAECINSSVDMDVFRPSLSQGPKAGHSVPHSVNSSPYRDCSHQGPPPNSSPLGNKNMGQHAGPGAPHTSGGSCSLQREGQKVARIRHQQHGRPGPDAPSPAELNQSNNQELKRKMDMSPYGYNNNSGQHHHQQPPVPPWGMRPPHHMSQPEEEQRRSYMELGGSGGQHSQRQQQQQQQGLGLPPQQPPPAPTLSQQQPQQQPDAQGPTQGENSAMKSLLKYSNQQQPLLLSQKSPFGGLGSLKSGPSGGSCALQGNKQTLPSRKGPADGERPDYSVRSRETGEAGHVENEVRQPPVGIAVAVARQREPPCRSGDSHPNSRQGRVHNSVKLPRSMYPVDPNEEERKRLNEEQMGLNCLDRDRDPYIDNKERVEFARIHPSTSCHGDLTSHLMVPGGTSLQSGQLGDPAAHSAHHHWMPRTGSPSLWMTGHSYIGHTPLHQNLPPGFSSAMPGPLQPVLPLPQDPSAQLVVLPSEPAPHPAPHHLVIEQQGLWPPVYSSRGPPSHMQHPAVYSRSQFLRQQELYAFQQHQQLQHQHQNHQSQQLQLPPQPQQQHRAAHTMQIHKRPDEPSDELEELITEPRPSKPAKNYSYNPPRRSNSPPGACATHLSPCYQSPSLRQHPRSTPSTPCPAPSPMAATPHSPAISPAPPQMLKGPESQDKRGEGQAPQDYPESLEPLPPGYTYPAIALGYRNGPSPQDVRLAQPADLEAVQAEPPEHAPQSLAGLEEELDCQVPVMPLTEPLPLKEVEPGEEESMNERALQLREEVEVAAGVNYVPEEEGADEEEDLLMFDLQSLATLATARALEAGSQESSKTGPQQSFSARRIFNLRRKFSWAPRNEPVCPAKVSMETMDGPELEMRVKLADIQRRYKEKQKELAKLQRKHDHKEETPRSPARRGPGRPRKRKPTLTTGPVSSNEGQRKVSVGVGLSSSPEDLGGGGETQRRKKRLSSQGFERISTVQASVDSTTQESWSGQVRHGSKKGSTQGQGSSYFHQARSKVLRGQRQEAAKEEESSSAESDSFDQDEEEEGSYETDEGQDFRSQPTRDITSGPSMMGPSPSSIVKLEANQKARNKKQRQELYAESEVKVKKKPNNRLGIGPAVKNLQHQRPEGGRRTCGPRSKESRWGSLGTRGNRYRKTFGMATFPTTSERLKRATRKSTMLRSKGRAVSRLLESFVADEGFQIDGSSFSEEEEVPNCILTKEHLCDGLKVLISKEDELLYAARIHTLEIPDFSIVIDGERGNRPRIYSLEQLLKEAVLDIRPESEAVLSDGTRVCAYWSERSRCLYPGYVCRVDEGKPGVMVEFDDGDRGKISLPNIRLLPPGYQIQRPKGSGKKQKQQQAENANKNPPAFLGWSSLGNTRKRPADSLFQFNGAPRKALRGKDDALFSSPQTQSLTSQPTKGLFSSSSFEVDSFRSIANGYSSFCSQSAGAGPGLSMVPRTGMYNEKRRQDDMVAPRSRKSGQEFLIKLDHEGVTSPKTKNSKALLLKSEYSSVSSMPKTEAYSHPVLLVKDNKKGGASRVELLLKGTTPQRKPSPSLRQEKYGDLGFSSHRECHPSYSDLDDEEEEEERRRAALAAATGGLRMPGRFLSRLSVSSSSSGSSSSSSSGSLSSSSLCSSDNDSSYSSDDEDSSALMLQSCLSSHQGLLPSAEPSTSSRPRQHSFVAKAVAVSSAKGGPSEQLSNSKPLKRKECMAGVSKPTKECMKKPRMLPDDTSFIPRPKVSAFLAGRQMWRWAGNPTQRRGLKGKARKLFYKAIVRGRDTVRVGDCAVFLSAGRPNLPYVGQIENFWESWTSRMVVKVKWFYHPEETKLGKRHRDGKYALYQSCHEDENDVQTISHKCRVVSREEYECLTRNQKPNSSYPDLYYLAGTYDPTTGQLVTVEGVSIMC
uniref:BAH domain and coiled-coil containing 1a n=1 Tax=Xiphophorus couchianus TaxID=32473 RepID=A0A3B5LPV1_9TELE